MTELRELIAEIIATRIIHPNSVYMNGPFRSRSEQDRCEAASDEVIAAIEASGRVTVDRARFERLLKPMQLYVQAEGIVVDFTGKGAIAFGKAFEDAVNEIRANPGDLEPLP